ncbi:hypothetical protein [Bathymodiolus japonicus methanotrophic gill symbiont]|uniref:hypothetical protein n=1 Tax=Bathymodiolus japonicus methanotrophic gill symbiont TaxID=113269 RepID=UPI001C8ECAFB|nr:hypothetical protein [Bathymodiolus japonicus methanotrophic gill symbiont]
MIVGNVLASVGKGWITSFRYPCFINTSRRESIYFPHERVKTCKMRLVGITGAKFYLYANVKNKIGRLAMAINDENIPNKDKEALKHFLKGKEI